MSAGETGTLTFRNISGNGCIWGPNYVTLRSATPGGCNASSETLCLRNNRFSVEVAYRFHDGTTGFAKVASAGTDESGLLYYVNDNNWEFLLKILDACRLNDHYWVFFAATTDVEFTVTVIDTLDGTQKQYFNALGSPADAVTDIFAFETCP